MEILGGTMQVCSLMPRAMLRCGVRRSRPADPPRLSCVGAGPRIAAVSPSAQKRIAGVGPVIDLWCRCDGPAAGPLRRESGGARAMDLFALRAYPPLPHGNGRGVPQRGMVDTVPFVDMAKLEVKYARSSGPGGQHVNKTESKVDLRLHVDHILLPPEVNAMERLRAAEAGRINKMNQLVITCDEHRERQRNYQTCLKKLADMLTLASIQPKVRNMKSKTAAKFNEKRLEEKRLKSTKKQSRRRDFD